MSSNDAVSVINVPYPKLMCGFRDISFSMIFDTLYGASFYKRWKFSQRILKIFGNVFTLDPSIKI